MELSIYQKEGWNVDYSAASLFGLYTANISWSIFLTSTAIYAIFLITSPVQAVLKWHKKKSSDSDTALPYIFGFFGSVLWLRYSIFIKDLKLILLQSYAVFMQILFLFIMLYYRSKKNQFMCIILSLFASIFCLFYWISQLSFPEGLKFTGLCASSAQIAGSFVCPYLIYKAISLQTIDFVPFAPVAFTWVMEIHAIIYSVCINDFYLLVGLQIRFFFVWMAVYWQCFSFIQQKRSP